MMAVNKGGDKWQLVSLQTTLAPLPDERWLSASAVELRQTIEEIKMEESAGWRYQDIRGDTGKPITFAFQTGSGAIGLLQITGFTENPRGVKISYKLVQNGTTNTPASQNAAHADNVNFTVAASGTAPLSYQWRFQDTNLPAAAQNLSFGPVIERTLSFNESLQDSFLDLDTGRLLSPPPDIRALFKTPYGTRVSWESKSDPRAVKMREWLRASGAKLMACGGEYGERLEMREGFAIQPPWTGTNRVGFDQTDPNVVAKQAEVFLKPLQTNSVIKILLLQPGYDPQLGLRQDTFLFITREGTVGVLQILNTEDNPRGVKIRYKLVQNGGTTKSAKISNIPLVKTVVLTRATNQLIDVSNEVLTVTVFSDSMVQPGETISALVKRGDGQIGNAHSMLFINWQPDGTRTSCSFSWFFGGVLGQGFGRVEAEAAVAQLREGLTDKPLALTSGKPLEVFSVTNKSGEIMAGYVEFQHTSPEPATGSGLSGNKPQAIVHLRRFTAFMPNSPSIDYSVKLPPGYALWATANRGLANTFTPAGPNQYHSSWMNISLPARPKPMDLQLGERPKFQLPPPPRFDTPAQREAQHAALETQFQELQDQGPIPVVLGEPKLLFSTTNGAGEVYQGFLELVGPPVTTNTP